MKGKLYGVGVGPGDPELMTLKAVRTITGCPVIAVPGEVREDTVSYQIASAAIPNLEDKECLTLTMPMTKKEDVLEESYRIAADTICRTLDTGKDVAFLTLGDPTIYSTFHSLHRLVQEAGYNTEMINGIPSFCAASALINQGLAGKSESLHIIPSSYGVEDALRLSGTKILMKAGRKMPQIKEALQSSHCQAVMIENCGMPQEQIYYSIDEIPDDASYYSLIIIKEEN